MSATTLNLFTHLLGRAPGEFLPSSSAEAFGAWEAACGAGWSVDSDRLSRLRKRVILGSRLSLGGSGDRGLGESHRPRGGPIFSLALRVQESSWSRRASDLFFVYEKKRFLRCLIDPIASQVAQLEVVASSIPADLQKIVPGTF